jgi:nucleoside-diphosphate-sugar epimerase
VNHSKNIDTEKPCILITGINGFLGSNLAKSLYINYNIIGIENKKDNISRISKFIDKDQVFENNAADLKCIFSKYPINIIIHTATSFGKNGESITEIAHSNYFSPLLLLEYAINNHVNTFINTDTVINKFVNEYSLFKRQFYDYLVYNKGKINIINMKLEHFYGGEASDANFITFISKKLLNNENDICLTKGEQKRDFVYISDVVEAFKLTIEKTDFANNKFEDYHVCTGNKISIKELVTLLKRLTGSNSNLIFGAISYRNYELMDTEEDNSSVKNLGWTPKINLEEGLIKTINYLRKNMEHN